MEYIAIRMCIAARLLLPATLAWVMKALNKEASAAGLVAPVGSMVVTLISGTDISVTTIDPTGATSPAAEASLLRAFMTQANVAGSSSLAAMHMRIAMYSISCGQWQEILRHLKAYASL